MRRFKKEKWHVGGWGVLVAMTAALLLMAAAPQMSEAQNQNQNPFGTQPYSYFWIEPPFNANGNPGVYVHIYPGFINNNCPNGDQVWMYYYDYATNQGGYWNNDWFGQDFNFQWPAGFYGSDGGGGGPGGNGGFPQYYKFQNGCYGWFLWSRCYNQWIDWYYCCRWWRGYPGPFPQ